MTAPASKPPADPAPADPPAPPAGGLPLWLWMALLTVAIVALLVVVGRAAFAG